jgi:putative oxidoreductase
LCSDGSGIDKTAIEENSMATLTKTPGKAAIVIAWTLQIVCAAMFLFAGGSKFAGDPAMVSAFATIGLGQWFRYLTGTIEVIGALLLLVPSLAFFGALALAVTMAGAVMTHLFVIGGSPAPAMFLFAATAAIAWLRRPVSLI